MEYLCFFYFIKEFLETVADLVFAGLLVTHPITSFSPHAAHDVKRQNPQHMRPRPPLTPARASIVFRIIISCTQLHTTTWTCPQPLKADRTEHTLTCLSLSCWRRCSSVLIWAAWAASVRPRSTATGGSAIVTVTVSQSNVIQKKHQTDLKYKLSKSLKTDFKQAVKVAQDRFQTSSQSPSRQNSNKLRQSHKHGFQTSCQSRSRGILNKLSECFKHYWNKQNLT